MDREDEPIERHYETLGVTPEFPSESIDGLRRTLGRIYDPETGSSPDAELMRAINRACDVLGDPEARAAYDRALTERVAPDESRQDTPTGPAVGDPAPSDPQTGARRDLRVPGTLFVTEAKWLTPPIGGVDVCVMLTVDHVFVRRARWQFGAVSTYIPLRSIHRIARHNARRSTGGFKVVADGGTYRFTAGWDDFAPALRRQLTALGATVVEEGPGEWKVI